MSQARKQVVVARHQEISEPRESIVDSLIEQFGWPESETLHVPVGAVDFELRVIVDRSAFNSIRKRARDFAKVKAAPTDEQRALLDTDDDTKVWSYVLSELCISPKLAPFDFLKVAKKACFAFDELKDGFLLRLAEARVKKEVEEIEARKNESSETSAGETA